MYIIASEKKVAGRNLILTGIKKWTRMEDIKWLKGKRNVLKNNVIMVV